MSGLTRFKNLSEADLNLKTGLQKLYAPGIEDDIELFSLSSSIKSVVISGPEEPDPQAEFVINTQIYGLSSEKISLNVSGTNTVFDRTKFLTKTFTFTNQNLVYLDKFKLSLNSSKDSFTQPIFSENDSIPAIDLVYGGRGFYFSKIENGTEDILHDDNNYNSASNNVVVIKNVPLIGIKSGSRDARADITFTEQSFDDKTHATDEGYDVDNTRRFTITNVVLTNAGTNYEIQEKLELDLGDVVRPVDTDNSTLDIGSLCIRRQGGRTFIFQEPILRTNNYYYEVRNADSDGFYLYDKKLNKYLFLDYESASLGVQDIDLRREDRIRIDNFLQFKFASSTVRLDGYNDTTFSPDGSISGNITSLGNSVAASLDSIRTTIQNTKRPENVDSDTNKLGYSYNGFTGRDVAFWQRLVIRDQDGLLDKIRAKGLSGDQVRDNSKIPDFIVEASDGTKFKVPGFYIKVGEVYKRAYSTTDKPFYNQVSSKVVNPIVNVSNSNNPNPSLPLGVLTAEAYDSSTEEWYAYDTVINEFAQRISVVNGDDVDDSGNGKNGALYFHRNVRIISTEQSYSTTSAPVYSTPLFESV